MNKAKRDRDFVDWLSEMISLAERSRPYLEGYAWAVDSIVRARKMRARLEQAIAGETEAISPIDALTSHAGEDA